MPAMNAYGKAGVSDVVACVNGKFFGIEVKADAKKNPPTELQKKNLREIEAAGGVSLVIDASNIDKLGVWLSAALGSSNV